MQLIFSHVRLDLGQFPDLMPARLGIVAGQFRAAAATLRGLHRLNVIALFGGNEWSLVLRMARLSAALLLGFGLSRRLGVRMLRTRRQRRVLRRLSAFQFRYPRREPPHFREQRTDNRLGLQPKTGQLFFREQERHTYGVAEVRSREKTSFPNISSPARERLPPT
jgi:hypothetical protein